MSLTHKFSINQSIVYSIRPSLGCCPSDFPFFPAFLFFGSDVADDLGVEIDLESSAVTPYKSSTMTVVSSLSVSWDAMRIFDRFFATPAFFTLFHRYVCVC